MASSPGSFSESPSKKPHTRWQIQSSSSVTAGGVCHINIQRFPGKQGKGSKLAPPPLLSHLDLSLRLLNGNLHCVSPLYFLLAPSTSPQKFLFFVGGAIFKVQVISIRDLHEGSRRQTVRAIRPERKLSLYPPSLSPATSSEQPPPPCLHLFPCCSFQELSGTSG